MSSKMSYEWYEECLNNSTRSLRDEECQILRKVQDMERHRERVAFGLFQLVMAKKKGVDSFTDNFQKTAWERLTNSEKDQYVLLTYPQE